MIELQFIVKIKELQMKKRKSSDDAILSCAIEVVDETIEKTSLGNKSNT